MPNVSHVSVDPGGCRTLSTIKYNNKNNEIETFKLAVHGIKMGITTSVSIFRAIFRYFSLVWLSIRMDFGSLKYFLGIFNHFLPFYHIFYHFLSNSIQFYHFPSNSITLHQNLSLSITFHENSIAFFHFLSNSITFHQILSLSITLHQILSLSINFHQILSLSITFVQSHLFSLVILGHFRLNLVYFCPSYQSHLLNK